jgi:hypothetical protein
MGEALRAGARGVEPPAPEVPDRATEATRMLQREAEQTEATRMMPPREPDTPVRQRAPAAARQRPREGGRQPAAPPPRRRGRRLGRALLVVALLAGLAAIGGIVLADEFSQDPQLRRVVQQDAERAIEEVRDFVEDNTQ